METVNVPNLMYIWTVCIPNCVTVGLGPAGVT